MKIFLIQHLINILVEKSYLFILSNCSFIENIQNFVFLHILFTFFEKTSKFCSKINSDVVVDSCFDVSFGFALTFYLNSLRSVLYCYTCAKRSEYNEYFAKAIDGIVCTILGECLRYG